MLQNSETITIEAGLEEAWRFVSDMANWAGNMPGYQSYEVADEADSTWVLKVGVGALVKTVRVAVHIEEWRRPEQVRFTYRLVNEPVEGDGCYDAKRISDTRTEVALCVRVRGGGPMAPVWEAMARPILPKLAHDFGASLKSMIEAAAVDRTTPPPAEQPSPVGLLARIIRWLSNAVRIGGRPANG